MIGYIIAVLGFIILAFIAGYITGYQDCFDYLRNELDRFKAEKEKANETD